MLVIAAVGMERTVDSHHRVILLFAFVVLLIAWQAASAAGGAPASIRWIVPPAAVATDERTQAVRWGRALGSAFLTDAPYLTTHLGLVGPVILGAPKLVAVTTPAYLGGRLLPYLMSGPAALADRWYASRLRTRTPVVSAFGCLVVALAVIGASCQNSATVSSGSENGCPTSPMTTVPNHPLVGASPLLGRLSVRPTGFRDGHLGFQAPAGGTLFEGSRYWGAKVLWVVITPSALPARVQGAAADARHGGTLRFNGTEGRPLQTELVIEGQQALDQGVPSYVRVDQPGCYQLHLTTRKGESTLTFQADFGE